MADLRIRALWQGDPVKKGISDLKADVHGLGTALSGVRGFAIAALGIGGLLGAATQVNAAIRSVNSELMIERRMMETLRTRSGDWARDSLAARKMVLDLQRSSKFADDELMDGLAQLTRLTGNTTTALTNMGLAAQVAEAFNKDLSVGVQTVAFVSQGFLDKASRLIPEMKGLNAELGDLKGTSEAAAIGMSALHEAVKGGSSSTGIGQLTKGWNEFRDSVLKLAADADSADTAFRKWANTLLDLSAAMDKFGEAKRRQDQEFVSEVRRRETQTEGSKVQFPLQWQGVNHPSQNTVGWRGFLTPGTRQPSMGAEDFFMRSMGFDPAWSYVPQGAKAPFRATEEAEGKKSDWRIDGISPYEYARDLPGFYRGSENRRGGIRGMGRRMEMFGGQLDQDKEPPAQKKWKEEWKRDQQEFGSLLSSTISSAFATGARDGGKAMIEELKNNFVDQLFSLLGNGIAMSLFPGFAPSGIAGAILGSKGGASSGTVSSANARARSIQQARMAAARG